MKKIMVLDATFLTDIVKLRNTVIQKLPNLNLCLLENDEETFVSKNICDDGMTVGFFDQAKLAAIGILSFTSPDHPIIEEVLKRENITYNKFALLNGTQVLPEHRGNGLQYRLINERMELATQYKFDVICAIASPDNHPSKNNLLRTGLTELATVEFYPNVERIIYIKRLESKN